MDDGHFLETVLYERPSMTSENVASTASRNPPHSDVKHCDDVNESYSRWMIENRKPAHTKMNTAFVKSTQRSGDCLWERWHVSSFVLIVYILSVVLFRVESKPVLLRISLKLVLCFVSFTFRRPRDLPYLLIKRQDVLLAINVFRAKILSICNRISISWKHMSYSIEGVYMETFINWLAEVLWQSWTRLVCSVCPLLGRFRVDRVRICCSS